MNYNMYYNKPDFDEWLSEKYPEFSSILENEVERIFGITLKMNKSIIDKYTNYFKEYLNDI
jgi:hypothetical protein